MEEDKNTDVIAIPPRQDFDISEDTGTTNKEQVSTKDQHADNNDLSSSKLNSFEEDKQTPRSE